MSRAVDNIFFSCRLLGVSAFAGFFVLLLGWPLNSFVTRRSIRIQKGVLAARDKRMGVLNELIFAVRFSLSLGYYQSTFTGDYISHIDHIH